MEVQLFPLYCRIVPTFPTANTLFALLPQIATSDLVFPVFIVCQLAAKTVIGISNIAPFNLD
jgi:hypothetical protein